MFLFKKIVSQFLFPMPLCLGISFLGLGLLWWTEKQKTGKWLVTLGLGVLTILSYSLVADTLLTPLEGQYPSYLAGSSLPLKYVVVLGGGHNSNPRFPVTSQIGDESLKRLAEGIRVQKLNPGSKLLLSGGVWIDPVSNAHVLATVAELFGVEPASIILEEESRDTEDQARLIKPIVSTNPFALVTSSSHMPRAMGYFHEQQLQPIAAPTDHLSARRFLEPGEFFPSSRGLKRSERAFYEYLGLLWNLVRAH